MEVSTEKSKIMTNSTNNISADLSMNGYKLEEVTSFKYVGATLCKYGSCSADVRIRIASAVAAKARLNGILRCNTISFACKFKRYKSNCHLHPPLWLLANMCVYACIGIV